MTIDTVEKCPECHADMTALGPYPDHGDGGKVKETFVCEKCRPLGQPLVTVRRRAAVP